MPKKIHSPRKITLLLQALSSSERSNFSDFVKSPYFNKDKKLIVIIDFLNNLLFYKEEPRITEKHETEVFSKTFGIPVLKSQLTKKERALLNDKLSKLTTLAIKFLTVNDLQADSPEKTVLLLRQLHLKKLTTVFDSSRRKEKTKLAHQQIDKSFYLKNYHLERSLFEFQFQYQISKLLKKDNLGSVIEALDVYFLIDRMLLHLASMALLSNVGSKSYDFHSMNTILRLSEIPKYKNIPAVKICRTACSMETCKLLSKEQINQDIKAQQHYQELIKLLNQENAFTRDFKEVFYTLAINFCSHQTRRNKNDAFQQKAFELYQQLESNGLMSNNSRVRASRLINGISFACQSGNYNWAEDVSPKYIPFIDKAIRKGVASFIQGQIAFYQKKYEPADQFFLETELAPQHRAYSTNCKIFRLKCLYEINQYSFEAANRKFRSEILQRKMSKLLSKNDKTGQINFIKILSDLYKIKSSIKIERKSKAIQRLLTTKNKLKNKTFIADVLWLEKKIEELRQQLE